MCLLKPSSQAQHALYTERVNPKSLDALVLRYASFALLFIGLFVMVYLVRNVLPVFIIGGVIAFALEPLLQRLEKSGRSRSRAVAFVFGVDILLLLILFSLLANAVQQGQSFVQGSRQNFEQINVLIKNAQSKLDTPRIPAGVRDGINNAINNASATAGTRVPALIQDIGPKILTGTGTMLVNVFLITLISFGLMLEAQRIKGRLLMLVPASFRRDATDLSTSINELLGRYVRGQLVVCATYGALATATFEVMSRVYGMDYPLVLGAVAACIYILPYFGLAIIIVLSVTTAYLTANPGQGAICAGITLACLIVFNLFVDYGVAPRVLGRGVGLHPLMVIFALLCGFELAGPLGGIAAVPIFASLRVIAIYLFPQLVAPLPGESPEKTSAHKATSATTEMGQRLAVATSKAKQQLPLNAGESDVVSRILDTSDEK